MLVVRRSRSIFVDLFFFKNTIYTIYILSLNYLPLP